MKKFIKIIDSIFAIIVIALFGFIGYGNMFLPNSIVEYDRQDSKFNSMYSCSINKNTTLVDYQTNSNKQNINVFGVIPVKQVNVTNKDIESVYVSGESFGIKLYTNGVIVVGTQNVDLGNTKVNPTKSAGIAVGDIIVSINGTNVNTSDEVENILNNNNGKSYQIKVKREGVYKTFVLKPVYCEREGCYKAGMWVRDSTAGIGTLTFYNNNNNTFATLGHQINDVDTNEIMPMLKGEAVSAKVTKIYKGTTGETGSLCCDFLSHSIGILKENTDCGVYGIYNSISENAKLYPVASNQEIKKGDAQILTSIDDTPPKYYDIQILHINYDSDNTTKNMVIKVTDETLLSKTGGIVQGMSGSPILQNGKFIGAVTHVIVNNPEKGYAIFAQTMVEKSNTVK